jgi:hypothetical protein
MGTTSGSAMPRIVGRGVVMVGAVEAATEAAAGTGVVAGGGNFLKQDEHMP